MNQTHTEVLRVNTHHPNKFVIERAASLLRDGQVVVFPTETVYGLGGDALQPQALERIFAAKERPYTDPLIVHIAEIDTLATLVTTLPPSAQLLANTFWPGPLTLILPASSHVPKLVTAGFPTVAVRMPRHPVALALIRATGSPIAAPSANRFMHVSPTTAQHALADLDGRVPLILDGGPTEVGVESTVLNLCTPVPTVLRPGGISIESLRHVLPEVVYKVPSREQNDEEAKIAPGQLLKHYAPNVPMYLYEGSAQAVTHAMLREIKHKQDLGERVGVLISDEDIPRFAVSGARIYTLGSAQEPEQIAANLFAGLRTLEDAGVHSILCRSFAEQGIGLAIRDRLRKAAGGKIITVNLQNE